jgi:hypothetical protein
MIALILSVLWWGYAHRSNSFGYELWIEHRLTTGDPSWDHHVWRWELNHNLNCDLEAAAVVS